LDIVKYIESKGELLNLDWNEALYSASVGGYLDIVKSYFV